VTRQTALLELLLELHTAYLQYHRTRVQTFSDAQVRFELESISALAPHAQMRFLNSKDLTVECVIPIYEGAQTACVGAGGSHSPASAVPQHVAASVPPLATGAGVFVGSCTCPSSLVWQLTWRTHFHSHTGGGTQLEACRLVLVIDQEMKRVGASLEYPSSTPSGQRAMCPPWICGSSHAFDLIPKAQAAVEGKLAVRRLRAMLIQQVCHELTPLFVDSLEHRSASFLCSLDASFEVRWMCIYVQTCLCPCVCHVCDCVCVCAWTYSHTYIYIDR